MSRFQVIISKTEFVRPAESFSLRKESVLWNHWRNSPFFRILTNKLSKDKIYIDKSTCLATLCHFVDEETCQGKTLMWWHKDHKTNWRNNKMRELSETMLGFSVLLFESSRIVSININFYLLLLFSYLRQPKVAALCSLRLWIFWLT